MILILFSSQIHVWFEHKPSILFSINEITTIIPHSSKTSVLWTYLFTLNPISKNSPQKLSLSPPYFILWPLSFHSSIVSVSFFPSDSFYYHSISAHFSCSFLLCYWQTSQMSKKNYFVIDCNDRIEFQCMHFCFSIFFYSIQWRMLPMLLSTLRSPALPTSPYIILMNVPYFSDFGQDQVKWKEALHCQALFFPPQAWRDQRRWVYRLFICLEPCLVTIKNSNVDVILNESKKAGAPLPLKYTAPPTV